MATKRVTRATKSIKKSGVKSLKAKALTSSQAKRVKGGGTTLVTTSYLGALNSGWDLKANKKS